MSLWSSAKNSGAGNRSMSRAGARTAGTAAAAAGAWGRDAEAERLVSAVGADAVKMRSGGDQRGNRRHPNEASLDYPGRELHIVILSDNAVLVKAADPLAPNSGDATPGTCRTFVVSRLPPSLADGRPGNAPEAGPFCFVQARTRTLGPASVLVDVRKPVAEGETSDALAVAED